MANKYTFKMVLNQLVFCAKNTVTDLAKKELSNTEKKAQLDNVIMTLILSILDGAKIGWITKLIIEKFVLPRISEITQAVYDLLKAKIEGVTA